MDAQSINVDDESKEVTLLQQWQSSRSLRLTICLFTILFLFGPAVHDVWNRYTIEVRMVPLGQREQTAIPTLTPTLRWSCTLIDG